MAESSQNILDSKMKVGLCLILPTRTVFKFFTAKLIRKMACFKLTLPWKTEFRCQNCYLDRWIFGFLTMKMKEISLSAKQDVITWVLVFTIVNQLEILE